jgi:hypothetical protein
MGCTNDGHLVRAETDRVKGKIHKLRGGKKLDLCRKKIDVMEDKALLVNIRTCALHPGGKAARTAVAEAWVETCFFFLAIVKNQCDIVNAVTDNARHDAPALSASKGTLPTYTVFDMIKKTFCIFQETELVFTVHMRWQQATWKAGSRNHWATPAHSILAASSSSAAASPPKLLTTAN